MSDAPTRVQQAWAALTEAWDTEQRPHDHGKWQERVFDRLEDFVVAVRADEYVPAIVSKDALAELAFIRDGHPEVWACLDVETGPALKPFRLLTRDLLALLPPKGTY